MAVVTLRDGLSFRLGPGPHARHSHFTPGAGVAINRKAKLPVVRDYGLDPTDCLIGIEFVEFLRRWERVLDLAEVQNLPLGGFPPFGFRFVELGERSLPHVFHVTHTQLLHLTKEASDNYFRDYDLIGPSPHTIEVINRSDSAPPYAKTFLSGGVLAGLR